VPCSSSAMRKHLCSSCFPLTAVTALATALAPGSGPARHSFRVLMVVGSVSCSMPEMAMAAELVPGRREGGRDKERSVVWWDEREVLNERIGVCSTTET